MSAIVRTEGLVKRYDRTLAVAGIDLVRGADDLPPTFARDEGLAQSLGMSQPVVSQAARRLGIPPEVLWGLSAHPDLVEMVERELAARSDDQDRR